MAHKRSAEALKRRGQKFSNQSLKVCNCARCDKLLVGLANGDIDPGDPDVVAGRINDRPFCRMCLAMIRRRGA